MYMHISTLGGILCALIHQRSKAHNHRPQNKPLTKLDFIQVGNPRIQNPGIFRIFGSVQYAPARQNQINLFCSRLIRIFAIR